MTVGLYALRIGAQLTLSSAISLNFHRYGPIGIVFVLLSWFVGFGVVMLGGAVVGAELWGARHPGSGESPESGGEADRTRASPARCGAPPRHRRLRGAGGRGCRARGRGPGVGLADARRSPASAATGTP